MQRIAISLPRLVARHSAATPLAVRHAGRTRSFAAEAIKVTFVKPSGEKVTVSAPIGDSMLEVAHANKIDIEGAPLPRPTRGIPPLSSKAREHPLPARSSHPAGACGGETACSTCHIILSPEVYAKLPEASEAEEDMLDLAAGLTKTSRLGCQVLAAKGLDGMEVMMPKEVNNMMGDK